MNYQYNLEVKEADAGSRLDLFIAEHFDKKYSRNSIKKIIDDGKVLVNDEVQYRPHYKVKSAEIISFNLDKNIRSPNYQKIVPVKMDLDILYEDENLLAINKDSGIVVHPAPGHEDDTLANAVKYYLQNKDNTDGQVAEQSADEAGQDTDKAGQSADETVKSAGQSVNRAGVRKRAGLIHRLDKATSGVILFAKNNQIQQKISKQFAERSIQKTYLALIKGEVNFENFKISKPIGRSMFNRKKFSSKTRKPRNAVTFVEKLRSAQDGDYTLLKVSPKTGRTHQIRVHLSEENLAVVGDEVYGGEKSARLMLHAYSIRFELDNRKYKITAPIKESFKKVLKAKGISLKGIKHD
jgi:23S rRNA pseudouridine1911/1915/1917 synthase